MEKTLSEQTNTTNLRTKFSVEVAVIFLLPERLERLEELPIDLAQFVLGQTQNLEKKILNGISVPIGAWNCYLSLLRKL